jgi:branched-chain amino acid transport system permease protein
VTFTAEAGQVTALIGPNGSGKTTLLNLISGFYRVDAGTVVVGDRDVTRLSPARVSTAGIGRTFQTPLVPEEMTVLEVVITGMYGWSRSGMLSAILRTPKYERARAARADLAQKILNQLGLQEHADSEAVSLALGTRRMLELARVLAGEKSVVLLDEVASGLDEAEVVELAVAVRQLSEAGATVILVEHNFALVKQIADRVVVLADGNVLAEGTPSEVEANEHVARVYLGEGAAISGTRTGTGSTNDGAAK